jgi:hypothetical protein
MEIYLIMTTFSTNGTSPPMATAVATPTPQHLGAPVTTPPWRTYVINAEDRTYVVLEEDRTYVIAAEDRTYIIIKDSNDERH